MRTSIIPGSLALAAVLLLAGCVSSYRSDGQVRGLVQTGEFSAARERVVQSAATKSDRRYALDRLKRLALSNAEGVPSADDENADRMYDVLRTQGINADKTVAAVFVGGGNVRLWKGEPFEQAMAYSQIAIHDAMQGDWGNARAAANNSLFLLRDFSESLHKAAEDAKNKPAAAKSSPKNPDEPMSEVATQKQQLVDASRAAKKEKPAETDPLGIDYRAVASNFELGYVLKAIAARQIGATEDFEEALATLESFAPHLSDLAVQIRSGQYNTVLVVDYGDGPEKVGAGYLKSITDFKVCTPSDGAMLNVSWPGGSERFPVVTDLNSKSCDLRWHAEEDMSKARAVIGTGVAAAGAGVAMSSRSTTGLLIGVGLMVGGAYLMATAQADTTYCEVLPQRTYVGLATLPESFQTIEVAVEGHASARAFLTGLRAPPRGEAQLRYVRLPQQPGPWAASGQVLYSNAITGEAPGKQLPFILGGVDVRPPTQEMLSLYRASGLPADIDLDGLISLYRAEGILIEGVDPPFEIGRHVLEGGNCLYTPLGGTVGFCRLYGQAHPAYLPRSAEVNEVLKRMQAGTALAAVSAIGGGR